MKLETDGTQVLNYNGFNDCIVFIADDTLGYAGTWNANALSSIPIGSSTPYTSRDTTSSIWSLDFNSDESEMFGTNGGNNEILHWSAVPPSPGTRTAIITGYDSGEHYVAYANFV